MNFGMPYMGSKNRIAENLISQLPPATHFYDLFGGGGAMSHCALLSGKYKYIHYNELDPLVFKGFKMFINGDFKTETRWISREDFFRLKDNDLYAAICFSFGNNLRTYAYNKECEKFKKAVHYSIFFNDNSLLKKYADLSNFNYNSEAPEERKLELQRYLKVLLKENKIEVNYGISVSEILQSQNHLERLNEYNSGNKIILTNQSYSDVKIEPDSVIYCDPPYNETEQYNSGFNHNEFYEWLRHSENRVYVSEYQMPDDFFLVYSVRKNCKLNNNSSKVSVENLYSNKPLENPLEF